MGWATSLAKLIQQQTIYQSQLSIVADAGGEGCRPNI